MARIRTDRKQFNRNLLVGVIEKAWNGLRTSIIGFFVLHRLQLDIVFLGYCLEESNPLLSV
jgi:hypothetical protein